MVNITYSSPSKRANLNSTLLSQFLLMQLSAKLQFQTLLSQCSQRIISEMKWYPRLFSCLLHLHCSSFSSLVCTLIFPVPISRELKMCIYRQIITDTQVQLCTIIYAQYCRHNLLINFTNKTCLPVSKLARIKYTHRI